MNFKQYEGMTTQPVSITVTEDIVNKYLKATKRPKIDIHQLPPAFPMIFNQFINVPWLHEQSFIHKEQTFLYENPIMIGETLQCTVSLISVQIKRRFLVLHQELIGKNEHKEVVFSAKSTLLKEAE